MKPTFFTYFLILTFSFATHAIELNDYDADVAALLLEYQGDEDVAALLREYQGTTPNSALDRPSVLTLTNEHKSSTYVDFERGLILIETSNRSQLKQAIIQVLLTQVDPKLIDAKTAQDFGLVNKGKRPFFWGQIVDHENRPIEYLWRAERFADYLIAKKLPLESQTRIAIKMVADHTKIAGGKYIQYAQASGRHYGIAPELIMAIMETESAFNPMARSRSNALGLMQVKANTAGRDYFSLIKGYKHTPTSAYLYDPQKNIDLATGYLQILSTRYLTGITHPKKLEYAMISSYNGGSGNLWKSLDPKANRTKATARINKMSVSEFYWFLTNRHIRGETRHYLTKVSNKQKKYTHL
ncbi:murein transglycosylase domain-containing protein [Shewanella sp. D64]|uniref:murein transglycosylase domain-containing protein n=1 Tax=unclassified Shewanella TaxID=196818 RepID=UPI0022BA5C17|nr:MULTISPECIES: murein transglycosylase domain-containing protein [unclassified Shewanella]MEC4728941.1 murein transglycosylase domain-containing protein [Shewanella sp. D64]MEC4738491.1 murein transglycosylase domain-containing protein [Shewanella sp. E94]WBJ93711.1 murein transglycosylase domain-containing protein [Shewanella sp. MTB7]